MLDFSFFLQFQFTNKMGKDEVQGRNYTDFAVCAANILFRHILGMLSPLNYDLPNLIDADKAFHDVLCNRSILSKIGGRRISEILLRVRQSRLPKNDFRGMVIILSHDSCDESQLFPIDMEEWRAILVRPNYTIASNSMNGSLLFASWRLPISIRHGALPHYSYADINRSALELADAVHILSLWQAACIAFTSETAAGSRVPFRQSAALVAQYFRVEDIDDSLPARKRRSLIDSLELGMLSRKWAQ